MSAQYPATEKYWAVTDRPYSRNAHLKVCAKKQEVTGLLFKKSSIGLFSLCLCVFVVMGVEFSFAQTFTQRGFIETSGTFFPQTAPNDDARAVGESLLRYEGFYRASNTFQIAGAIDLTTDTHRQAERDFKVSWQDREIRRPMAAIRRLSGTYHNGAFTFEAGKQFIRWGKTDIVAPTDRFAPRDFLTVVDNEFLAVTAARLSYEKGANTVEAVWSPRFTPSRIPLANQRWAPQPPEAGFPIQVRERNPVFPGGPQAGIRWNHTGPIEYELSLYQGFNHLPSFEAVGVDFVSSPPTVMVDIQRFFPKMLMAGGDVAVPTPLFTVKAEAAHFSSSDERADEYGLYVLQLERQAGEWFFVGGYAGEAITHRGSRTATFAPDRGLTQTFLGRAGYTIDANRTMAVETAVRQNGDGFWMKGEYSQTLGQHWRATLNVTVIRGDAGDFLGQYRRNSHVLVIARYSF